MSDKSTEEIVNTLKDASMIAGGHILMSELYGFMDEMDKVDKIQITIEGEPEDKVVNIDFTENDREEGRDD